MARFIHRGSQKIGETPGTPTYVGKSRDADVRISRFDYTRDELRHDVLASVEDETFPLEAPWTRWLNIDGVHDARKIEEIRTAYGLHPLLVEDVMHTGQRPKVEDYAGHLFIVLRMLQWDEDTDEIDDEQVSIVLGGSWILSFQEREGDVFDRVRERLLGHRGRIRKAEADYLAYTLVDAIVDHYFIILETLGERIEALGEDMAEQARPEHLKTIQHLKRELLFMRKSVWPLREVLSALQRDESDLFADSTRPYLRDVYDHTIQIIDTVETFRDMVAGQMDIYLSSISNRMNEVMKVLTIIATIFIPLTFIAGIYGMNFAHMPELQWRFGYFAALGVMLCVAVGMLVYFKRKKWL